MSYGDHEGTLVDRCKCAINDEMSCKAAHDAHSKTHKSGKNEYNRKTQLTIKHHNL